MKLNKFFEVASMKRGKQSKVAPIENPDVALPIGVFNTLAGTKVVHRFNYSLGFN